MLSYKLKWELNACMVIIGKIGQYAAPAMVTGLYSDSSASSYGLVAKDNHRMISN